MKPSILNTVMVLLTCTISLSNLFAQSPEKMSYQAVVRNSSNALVVNTQIGMRISILQGSASGAAVYSETQTPTTNANGLVSIQIGGEKGFDDIDWSAGSYFIQTETDPAGGTSYTITGTSQLLSVPYALHAKTAGKVTGPITEADPFFKMSEAANITSTDITNLSNLSGTNTGDQDLSTLATRNHTHGNITSDGKVGTAVGRIITTGANGTLQATAGTAAGQILYWNGSAWVNVPPGSTGQVLTYTDGVPTWTTLLNAGTGSSTDVYNPTTGKVWMDRNLGATQVATSSTDANAYGYLYQWGRGNDGHQVRTSGTTTTLSSTDTPGHGNFIIASAAPWAWCSPQLNNLWQGVSGVNNPCPAGYRLPTIAEWEAERLSWSANNAAGAFASPLKLTLAGNRGGGTGLLYDVGTVGRYWSGTVDDFAGAMLFYSTAAGIFNGYHAEGFSVRCLKD